MTQGSTRDEDRNVHEYREYREYLRVQVQYSGPSEILLSRKGFPPKMYSQVLAVLALSLHCGQEMAFDNDGFINLLTFSGEQST